MKLTCVLAAVVALVLQDPASEGQRWWSHVAFLASDSLEGRNVGTAGFEKAAVYVEGQFKDIGLMPGGTEGYRQPVEFESRMLVPAESRLALVRNGQEEPLAMGEDARLSPRGELDGSLDAPLVFIGYGLSIPEAKWDELAGLDLHGKIAVYVNAPAPVEVSDNVRSHVGSAGERWAVLKKAGAVGMATLPNLSVPTATPPQAAPAAPALLPQRTLVLREVGLQEQAGQAVSIMFTRQGSGKLLVGSGHSLDELSQLVAEKKPLPRFPLAGTLRARAALKRDTVRSENIVGIYEGTDPTLKSEYVVMSAHLDHLGVGRAVKGDDLYNGAMDDASGVASLIEVARLLKQSGARPRRSFVFLAVTAEEEGLLGSKYFAAHPTVPFERIVADINLDMFLPLYPLKVIEVQGLAESSLGEAVRAAAKELGVEVQTDREPDEHRFIRSDQYSFIRRGIPSLAFKFGYEAGSPEETIRREWVRNVYHKPNDDTSQTLDREAAARFDRVILSLLERVADTPARPTWNENSFFKRFAE